MGYDQQHIDKHRNIFVIIYHFAFRSFPFRIRPKRTDASAHRHGRTYCYCSMLCGVHLSLPMRRPNSQLKRKQKTTKYPYSYFTNIYDEPVDTKNPRKSFSPCLSSSLFLLLSVVSNFSFFRGGLSLAISQNRCAECELRTHETTMHRPLAGQSSLYEFICGQRSTQNRNRNRNRDPTKR